MFRHSVFASIFAVLATSAALGPVVAQTRPTPLPAPGNAEATIYRDANYSGPGAGCLGVSGSFVRGLITAAVV